MDGLLNLGLDIELPLEVVRHINVLRLRVSDEIALFNGDGHNYRAKFIHLEKRSALVSVIDKQLVDNESHLKITLLMSLIANDKFDLVVQKAVELGVTNLIPIFTQNTQRNFSAEKVVTKLEHWQKIIVSATEQSHRARVMEIQNPLEFTQALGLVAGITPKYILSPHHASQLADAGAAVIELVLCVGPEGGFTEYEINHAVENGFSTILLGNRIMRAETAALSGISVLQAKFGDLWKKQL